ncbi:MAG: choice-of-anchor Q domain-containing protein [Planctomycetota bacterium]|nr:choice-of-anchor Q domain-containing protein [Planctomycetota bacterium]
MKGTLRSILVGVALYSLAASAVADQIFVDPESSTIQIAIDAACDGDEIIVAPGTYHEAIDLLGKAVMLRSAQGPELTIIDASGKDSSVVLCDKDETSATVIEGFTLTGGTGTYSSSFYHGGGLFVRLSAPTIRDCIFEGNVAEAGGGVSLYVAWPTIEGCIFRNNEATFGGDRGGGGLHSLSSYPVIVNCVFAGNLASGPASGGGVAITNGQPEIIGCLFSGNEGLCGGGLRNDSSKPAIVNCTFVGNVSRYEDCGAAMYSYGNNAEAVVTGCIFWDNYDGANGVPIVDYFYGADTSVFASLVQGGWDGSGSGNIDADPLFVNAANGDLRLLSGSPCIDAGDTAAFLEFGLDCDLDGNPRPVDGGQGGGDGGFSLMRRRYRIMAPLPVVDMGAYEYQP